MINAVERAKELRKTLIRGNDVLVADFSGTLQGKDTSKVIELMPNVETGDYVFRTKVNVKALDPVASEVYKQEFFDIRGKTDSEIETFVKSQEFDFPLWFKHHPSFSYQGIRNFDLPFISQVAGCNFHDGTIAGGCTYCFVDNESNDGLPGKGKSYLSPDGLVDSFIEAKKKISAAYEEKGYPLDLKVIRTSGGEPTIALDWVLNVWREVGARGLDFVGQLDSNLSTGTLVDEFERQGIYEPHILEKLGEYPVKVLTAIKGTDSENICDNVQAKTNVDKQLYSMKRFLRAGFDIYPQMYNPNPKTLRSYLESLDSEIENASLRVHIGPLKPYRPTTNRLDARECCGGIGSKTQIAIWDSNYKVGCEILEAYLQERHGVAYKEVTRSDVELKIKA